MKTEDWNYLIVLGGEGVAPHAVGVVGVLLAAVAASVARVLGEVFYNGQTRLSRAHLR